MIAHAANPVSKQSAAGLCTIASLECIHRRSLTTYSSLNISDRSVHAHAVYAQSSVEIQASLRNVATLPAIEFVRGNDITLLYCPLLVFRLLCDVSLLSLGEVPASLSEGSGAPPSLRECNDERPIRQWHVKSHRHVASSAFGTSHSVPSWLLVHNPTSCSHCARALSIRLDTSASSSTL
jgi:hypothetical protein